ncbi:unnamed protein product [Nesidiocoris tenuis]|uniref:Uncharacterized protein n=1 Tax=Nesidiocoris tenuis TaxID=355587 RepID=A0A6H5GV69_9HEMI|nr:unnamed protein product [Nesidiocoris tenuis]
MWKLAPTTSHRSPRLGFDQRRSNRSPAMADVKSFFHQWCVKKGVEPTFETRPTGEDNSNNCWRLSFINFTDFYSEITSLV